MELAELQATVTIVGPYFIKSIPLTDTPRSSYWLEKLDVDAILGSVEFMNNVALRIDNREELLRSYKEILETALQIDKGIQRNLHESLVEFLFTIFNSLFQIQSPDASIIVS